MKKTWIITASAILGILIVGIAIPKLTVHDTVSAGADRSCVDSGIQSQRGNNLLKRLFFATGAFQITQAERGTGEAQFYTLFRIPIGGQMHTICDYAINTPDPIVSAAKVPDGWYSHTVSGIDSSIIVLTKTKDFPATGTNNYAYGEHIEIVQNTIGISPEEYVKQTLNLPEDAIQYQNWSIFFDRKVFRVGYTREDGKQQRDYIFSADQVVILTLYPDKQENRAAFQQVENHYLQTLPELSREDTQASCKTTDLPPGQEYDITADPGTGYVTIGYWPDSEPGMGTPEKYVFLNYNDDLSQCTPSIRKELERAKVNADKMIQ